MLTSALVALAVVAALFYLLGKRSSGRPRHGVVTQHTEPYAAISIEPAPIACSAARRIAGKRYLRREAPAVPLDSCDGRRCGCRLQRHPDRRQGGTDRRLGLGLKSELYLTDGNQDRREVRRGRRRSDLLPT